jgi:hypothetical protein
VVSFWNFWSPDVQMPKSNRNPILLRIKCHWIFYPNLYLTTHNIFYTLPPLNHASRLLEHRVVAIVFNV